MEVASEERTRRSATTIDIKQSVRGTGRRLHPQKKGKRKRKNAKETSKANSFVMKGGPRQSDNAPKSATKYRKNKKKGISSCPVQLFFTIVYQPEAAH